MTTVFPILETARLILRQLTPDDVNELLRLRSNESVNRYLDRKPVTLDEAKAFIRRILDAEKMSYYWVICRHDDTTLMGTICLWNFSEDGLIADIGYELSPEYQGDGIMSEAAQAAIKYGFGAIGLKTIIGVTHFENAGSVSLLTRNGFELDIEHLFLNAEEAKDQAVYFRHAE